jgi:hypothetical protein
MRNDRVPMRPCGTMEVHERLLMRDLEYRRLREASEANARQYESGDLSRLRPTITRIPVVVHIVHHPSYPETNVSGAQIQSQIEAMSRDFRGNNADAASIPAPFKPLAFDTRIEFTLATEDPNGDPTDGITRTQSDKAYFTTVLRDVMSAATGGADAWPSDRYLNVWVCGRLIGVDGLSRVGYATFPGVSDGKDGIVNVHWAFGSGGSTEAPFDLGRTAVHEAGHWLNLLHLWGDAEGCGAGDDFVGDTPPQAGPNFEFPDFPHVSCDNGPNGDMFMNYMDNTDDACLRMFTPRQALRMHAALDFDRPGFKAIGGP